MLRAVQRIARMKRKLKTIQGRKLYGLRKQTVEPVFGIIKSVMGFRQFLLRGLDAVRGEWNLVTIAWNIKKDGGSGGIDEQESPAQARI